MSGGERHILHPEARIHVPAADTPGQWKEAKAQFDPIVQSVETRDAICNQFPICLRLEILIRVFNKLFNVHAIWILGCGFASRDVARVVPFWSVFRSLF
jgi:hypothetical protein